MDGTISSTCVVSFDLVETAELSEDDIMPYAHYLLCKSPRVAELDDDDHVCCCQRLNSYGLCDEP